jgi:hypothetical protein
MPQSALGEPEVRATLEGPMALWRTTSCPEHWSL